MPRPTGKRYPVTLAAAVSQHMKETVQLKADSLDISASELLRRILSEALCLERPNIYILYATQDECDELRSLGHQVEEW